MTNRAWVYYSIGAGFYALFLQGSVFLPEIDPRPWAICAVLACIAAEVARK